MKRETFKNEYESPRVDFLCVVVEKGFAQSSDFNPDEVDIDIWA